MELEGHPTFDIIEELRKRGAIQYSGTSQGPHVTSSVESQKATQQSEESTIWLMLPKETFDTGLDELPSE